MHRETLAHKIRQNKGHVNDLCGSHPIVLHTKQTTLTPLNITWVYFNCTLCVWYMFWPSLAASSGMQCKNHLKEDMMK